MTPKEFYSNPWVASALVQQFKRRYVTMRWDFGMRRHYNGDELGLLHQHRVKLWGRDQRPFFEIHGCWGNTRNPIDLTYYINTGVIEFIPEVSTINDLDRTDTVIVDLDPKDPNLFGMEHLIWATKVVHAAITVKGGPLDANFGVEMWKFRFSGNRSFHIIIKLKKLYPLDDIRLVLKENLDPVRQMYPVLDYQNSKGGKEVGPARTDFILVDIGALSRHRCVRSLWSMHAKTGLICVPVWNIETFQKDEAAPEVVLSKGQVTEPF